MQRVEITVEGNIQRVGYRVKVVEIAKNLNIKGEIENLEGGNVKVIAEGEKEKLEEFIEKIKIKDELINVEDLSVKWSKPTTEFTGFRKIVKEKETDERLDTAAVHLKKLIKVTEYGIEETKKGFANLSDKQDQMLGKQDQTINIIKEGNEKLGEKIDSGNEKLSDKMDKVSDRIGKAEEGISSKIDNLTGSINNSFNNIDLKYGKISERMEKILEELKEEKEKSRLSMERLINAVLKLAEKK